MNIKVTLVFALFLQSFHVVLADNTCDCKCEESSSFTKYGICAAALLSAPWVLPYLGFTAAGIVTGSFAAKMMSWVYWSGRGKSILAILQSLGAKGFDVKHLLSVCSILDSGSKGWYKTAYAFVYCYLGIAWKLFIFLMFSVSVDFLWGLPPYSVLGGWKRENVYSTRIAAK